MNRDAEGMKVSVHASGQIHMRLGRRDLQPLAPPLLLDGSDWYHALEIRYLIGPDRSVRPHVKKLKKKEKAYLIDVSDGNALVLDLMVAPAGPLPVEAPQFGGAKPLWRTSLTDGRHVLLIGRVMQLSTEDQSRIEDLRGPDGPKVTFDRETPTSVDVELTHVCWNNAGGNVVLIVPSGSEAIRKLGRPASLEPVAEDRRQPEVDFLCPDASLEIRAPNGRRVALLVLESAKKRLALSRNEAVTAEVGQFRLRRFDEELISGQRFELPPLTLPAAPSIAGLQPREWKYTVGCTYDGTHLTVTIRPMSVGLPVGETATLSELRRDEEVMLTAPASEVRLRAAPGDSDTVAQLQARLILRDASER